MTEFVEMKTAELKGVALDWAVAIVVKGKVYDDSDDCLCPPEGAVQMNNDDSTLWLSSGGFHPENHWMPSADWAQCGPLLETQYIELSIGDEEYWACRTSTSKYDDERVSYAGSSMLIAACRAIVGEKIGQTVSVPKELLPC